MYRTEIEELAGGKFRVNIYNGRNKLVFTRIRGSYAGAQAEQVTFMYTGPDSPAGKKAGIPRKKKGSSGGPTGAPPAVLQYLFGEG